MGHLVQGPERPMVFTACEGDGAAKRIWSAPDSTVTRLAKLACAPDARAGR
jgi:hypothetical protein